MQCQNALNIFCLTHYPLLKSVSLLNAVENLQIFSPHLFIRTNKKARYDVSGFYLLVSDYSASSAIFNISARLAVASSAVNVNSEAISSSEIVDALVNCSGSTMPAARFFWRCW